MQEVVRFEVTSDDGRIPPQTFFTDSNGRINIVLVNNTSYILTVESDGKTWATTVLRFTILGNRPIVQVDLRPIEFVVVANGDKVSAATLKADVPPSARKEYESAIEQIVQGHTTEARSGLERAITLYPDYVAARNELAVALMKQGELSEAETHLRRSLETDSSAVQPLLNLGLCLYRQERYTDALPFLQKGVQLAPQHPGALLLLGMTLVMSGDDKSAEPVLLRSYQTEGKKAARAQFYLSHIYTRAKDYRRAADALEIYLRDKPAEPNAVELRATLVKLQAATARP
ncbi:MAG: tetratricopeptide repeat protein [Acidobacteria bacterium]|nr:tetratricopeptide repeat protein [Acidobacteriota bacterium]